MEAFLKKLHAVREQNRGRRISFVSGNFKLLHAGHIRLLRFAKEMSDLLVVGVLPANDFNRDVSEADRLESLLSLKMVDHVFVLRSPLEQALEVLRPNFVVKGKEHENQKNPEKAVLEKIGGRLIFSSGAITPSAADIRATTRATPSGLVYPMDFLERHAIREEMLTALLDRLSGLRAMVIGDVIVDEYISCDPLGMSQEDPTIVVSPVASRSYLGGAGIVAAHAASLGARVQFFTVCGKDATAGFVRDHLARHQVEGHVFTDETRPTPLKQRYRCRGKTLLRVSHLRQHALDQELWQSILENMEQALADCDLLVFSDFNYGCLPQPLVDRLIRAASAHGIPIAADSQSSSQVGDVSRFTGAKLLTPTEREARLALHDFESGLVVLADRILRRAQARYAFLTLGETGMIIRDGASATTDQLPALNPAAVDTAGAGDSLLVTTSLALAAGADIWQAALLGSLAAAVQVDREGNIPLRRQELAACLEVWKGNGFIA